MTTASDIDRAIEAIVEQGEQALDLSRVTLFGSRARGDAREGSDIDLAFEHASPDADWAEFVTRMAEQAPVLVPLDLVDFARADPALQSRIREEGRVLYG